MFLSLLDNNCQ